MMGGGGGNNRDNNAGKKAVHVKVRFYRWSLRSMSR